MWKPLWCGYLKVRSLKTGCEDRSFFWKTNKGLLVQVMLAMREAGRMAMEVIRTTLNTPNTSAFGSSIMHSSDLSLEILELLRKCSDVNDMNISGNPHYHVVLDR